MPNLNIKLAISLILLLTLFVTVALAPLPNLNLQSLFTSSPQALIEIGDTSINPSSTLTDINEWAIAYGEGVSNLYVIRSIQEIADGYIAVGSAGDDLWVLRINNTGSIIWQQAYDQNGKRDYGIYIEPTTNGFFVVGNTGEFIGTNGSDVWVLLLDQDGGVEWQAIYGGSGSDFAYSAMKISTGGFMIVGCTTSYGIGDSDIWVLKLKSDGLVDWGKAYGAGKEEIALSIDETDNGFVIGGNYSVPASTSDGFLLKIDFNGTVLQQRTFDTTDIDTISSVQVTNDNNYIIAGSSLGGGNQNIWVMKYDHESDEIIWSKTYAKTGCFSTSDYANSIRVLSDGGYAVVGYIRCLDSDNDDSWILRLDPNGEFIWQKTVGDDIYNDRLQSILEISDSLVIAGFNRNDAWLIKFGTDGGFTNCGTISNTNAQAMTNTTSMSNFVVFESSATPVVFETTATPFRTNSVTLGVCPSYSVSGLVTNDDDDPIPGVRIQANTGNKTYTDTNGNYTLTNVIYGTHILTPVLNNFIFAPASRTVSVPPDWVQQNFIIRPIPTPFLDLPFEYDGTVSTFVKSLQDTDDVEGGGRVNSWFDHKLPDYGEDNGTGLWLYNSRHDNEETKVNDNGLFAYDDFYYDGHNGIDFKKKTNTDSVLAVADGIVWKTVKDCPPNVFCAGGYGNQVWIDHQNGYATQYAHLKYGSIPEDSIKEAEPINSGQPIAMIGNTGWPDMGVHLHFGLYYDKNGDKNWTEDEVMDPFGWNPLDNPSLLDPSENVTDLSLWLHPLNVLGAVGSEGGSISSASGRATFTIPFGALTETVSLEVWDSPSQAGTSAQLRQTSNSFWLRVLEWQLDDPPGQPTLTANYFAQPVTVTVGYTDSEILHLDENQLTINRWNSDTNSWLTLPTNVDINQNQATAQTTDVGNFDLQAPLLCQGDTTEPNDSYYAASQLSPNSAPQNQWFDIPQDQDWLYMEATAGGHYTLRTSGLEPEVDTFIRLYDRDGITLLTSDDNSGEGMASEIVWQATTTGTYFIRITYSDGGVYGCNAGYNIELKEELQIYLPIVQR